MSEELDYPTLIHLALEGSPPEQRRATAQLLAEVEPVIRYACFRILTARRGDADHEEVAQAAMVELISSLRRFRFDGSLTSFAFSIATNQAKRFLEDENRQARLRAQGHDLAWAIPEPAPPRRPDQEILGRDLLNTVLGQLERILTAQELMVFHLLYADEQTVAEIMRLTHLSAQHVRQVRYHIRRKAKAVLTDLEQGAPEAPLHQAWS